MKRIIDFENVVWSEEAKRILNEPEEEMEDYDVWLKKAQNYTWDDYMADVKKWNIDPTKKQKVRFGMAYYEGN